MRKLFIGAILSLLLLLPFLGVVTPLLAQSEKDSAVVSIREYDDWDWDDDWDLDTDNGYTSESLGNLSDIINSKNAAIGTLATIFAGGMAIVSSIFSLALYVYMALALMKTAQKLGSDKAWYAWIPILNAALLLSLGEKNPWLILLVLIPGIGAIVVLILTIIATMNICEKRGYDKLLGLLSLIPIANLILWGILAWGKKAT